MPRTNRTSQTPVASRVRGSRRGPAQPAGIAISNAQLRTLLAERTRALEAAHLRLRMSDRLASIGALAAGLGHDMNNVLLPVRAHLEAARAGALVPSVRRHIDAVHKSVTYLQQLADGLHFLALDTEGEDSERTATDLSKWWAQVGPLLTKAVPRHVRVRVSIPAALPDVAVSAHGLTQAVLNLVVNAGEAIPAPVLSASAGRKAAGLVRIEAAAEKGGRYVRLSVIDNGRGMSQETRRRALEMFYTTRPRNLGTGLGLPLAARVVTRAGGSLSIQSKLGVGTTVALDLPVFADRRPQGQSALGAIRIEDARDAALIRHLFAAVGFLEVPDGDLTRAQVLVTEPTSRGLSEAKTWRHQQPRAQLVVLGKPGRALPPRWEALCPIQVKDRADLSAIRRALAQASSSR